MALFIETELRQHSGKRSSVYPGPFIDPTTFQKLGRVTEMGKAQKQQQLYIWTGEGEHVPTVRGELTCVTQDSRGPKFSCTESSFLGFPGGSEGKESACTVGDPGSIHGKDDPRRRERQPSPVILPAESPWTEEPGRLQPMGSHRVRHN